MPPGVSRLPAVVFERQAVLAVVVVEVAPPRPRPQPPELSLAVPEEAETKTTRQCGRVRFVDDKIREMAQVRDGHGPDRHKPFVVFPFLAVHFLV